MIYLRTACLAAALMFYAVEQTVAQVNTVSYKGWQQAYAIGNEQARMIVVPAVGKIMSFAAGDGENLIWNNDTIAGMPLNQAGRLEPTFGWANYGGDRFWVVQQHDIAQLTKGKRWPPDTVLEGLPWEALIDSSGTLQLKSGISQESGVQAQRSFQRVPDVPMIHITQSITATTDKLIRPLNLIQNVTAIKKPDAVIFKIPSESNFKYGPLENSAYPTGVSRKTKPGQRQTLDEILSIMQDYAYVSQSKTGQTGKIYTDIRSGWVSCILGDQLLVLLFKYYPDHYYPDGGSTMEIYVSDSYFEIELLSPATVLRPHEKIQFDIYYAVTHLKTDDLMSLDTAIKCEKIANGLLARCQFPSEVFLNQD
jgi:hypothetical protein